MTVTRGQVEAAQWRGAAQVLREHATKFDALAEEADQQSPWLVPPEHRPTCPLSDQPCTSWTCLVDVCCTPDDPRVTGRISGGDNG